MNATYRQLIDSIAENGLFSADELRRIYAENAARVYGLPADPYSFKPASAPT